MSEMRVDKLRDKLVLLHEDVGSVISDCEKLAKLEYISFAESRSWKAIASKLQSALEKTK